MTDNNYNKLPEVRRLQQVKALDMRLDGAQFTEIAEALGVSATSARNYVAAELERRADPTFIEAKIVEHQARYDSIIADHWEKAKTNEAAAYLVLNTMARQEKLLGLAAANKIEVSVTNEKPKDELEALLNSVYSRAIEVEQIEEGEDD